MLQTVFVYSFLAFSMFSISKLMTRANSLTYKALNITLILLYSLIFGVRYGVGTDYLNYLDIYENWGYGIDDESRIELGFATILSFCSNLNLSKGWLFFILSFLQIFVLSIAINKRGNVAPYIYLFFIILGVGIQSYNNIIRQAIAFSIFVVAIDSIVEKRMIKYLILITLATFFHKSAILLYPVYFLFVKSDNYFKDIKIQLVLLCCSYILFFVNIFDVVVGYFDFFIVFLGYDNYLDSDFLLVDKSFSINNIFIILFQIVIILCSSKVKEYYNDRYLNIVYDLFFVALCLSNIFRGSESITRILVYFSLLNFIVCGYYLNYFIKNYLSSYMTAISYFYFVFYLCVTFSYFVLYKSYDNCTRYATIFQTELYDEQEMMQYNVQQNF